MVDEPLITKYRPKDFASMVGHEEMISALRNALATPSHPHSYLLVGPSGTGKTTMARIIAREVKAEAIEVDAASNSGVEAMRDLIDIGGHLPMLGANRMLIIDECHSLSRSAWQATLKILEEPPPHLYLALCTTEQQKVPETVRTRCFNILLRPVSRRDIEDLLDAICALENWEVPLEIRRCVIEVAQGSPRKALTTLDAVHTAKTVEEVRRVISLLDDSEPIVDLCQMMLRPNRDWSQIQAKLDVIEQEDFASAAMLAGGYLAGCMMHSKTEKSARNAWELLEALLYPSQTWNPKASFLAAIGRMMWSES